MKKFVREVQTDGTRTREYCQHGTPTLVQSKWGPWGQYEHPPATVPDSYLPPDNRDTPQNERDGGISYYEPPQTRKDAAAGKPDPGKEQHTLKEGLEESPSPPK
ncbi:MAG: hypothetical protein AB1599_09095 [Planctomycetota bacterium]